MSLLHEQTSALTGRASVPVEHGLHMLCRPQLVDYCMHSQLIEDHWLLCWMVHATYEMPGPTPTNGTAELQLKNSLFDWGSK